jgi:zinc protease
MKRVSSILTLLVFSACATAPPPPATPPPQPVATVQPQPSADEVFRATAPAPLAARPWQFPRVERVTLPNGLRVLVAENHSTPLASIRVVVRSGAEHDPGDHAGLASLTADLLDEGAGTMSAVQIAEAFGTLGTFVSTGAEWDNSVVDVDVLSRNVDAAVGLVADVVRRPNFPTEDIERLRRERLATLLQRRDNASTIANERFSEIVYRGTPYGKAVIGSEPTIGNIGRPDVLDFYGRHYIPNNTSVIVAGDINAAQTIELIRRHFGDWERGASVSLVDVTAPAIQANRIYVIDRPQAVQSEIRVGAPGVERTSSDYFPLLTMNMLLGGNFSSRINLNLRERHGYTYGARSAFFFRREPGPFVVSTPVRNEVTLPAVQEIFNELRGIRTGDITDDEMRNTKNYLIGVFPAMVESPSDLANRLQEMEVYGLPESYFDQYRERIAAVTEDDIRRVANKYLDPAKMAIVVVGKAETIREPLSQLGYPVAVYDIEGRPVTN